MAVKTARITISGTPDFKAFLIREAKKEGVSLSQLVRQRCEKKPVNSEDEERGRGFAREKNLLVRGSLGVLIEAYAKKMISEDQLRFYFRQISERKDIWINPDLCAGLLERLFTS